MKVYRPDLFYHSFWCVFSPLLLKPLEVVLRGGKLVHVIKGGITSLGQESRICKLVWFLRIALLCFVDFLYIYTHTRIHMYGNLYNEKKTSFEHRENWG